MIKTTFKKNGLVDIVSTKFIPELIQYRQVNKQMVIENIYKNVPIQEFNKINKN